jgi:hypothetical protein
MTAHYAPVVLQEPKTTRWTAHDDAADTARTQTRIPHPTSHEPAAPHDLAVWLQR